MSLILAFFAGAATCFAGLLGLGKLLKRTGPNSRVHQKENVVAVLVKPSAE